VLFLLFIAASESSVFLCLADIEMTYGSTMLAFCRTWYMLAFNTVLQVTVQVMLELVLHCSPLPKMLIAYI